MKLEVCRYVVPEGYDVIEKEGIPRWLRMWPDVLGLRWIGHQLAVYRRQVWLEPSTSWRSFDEDPVPYGWGVQYPARAVVSVAEGGDGFQAVLRGTGRGRVPLLRAHR